MPGFLFRQTQEHTQSFREGSKLIKVIHLTDNQASELSSYIYECNSGPWFGQGDENPFPTPEDECAQWYPLVGLIDTHVTHYLTPTHPRVHGQKLPDPHKHARGPFFNDIRNSVEASVSASTHQIAQKLFMSEVGLKRNSMTTQLLTSHYFSSLNSQDLPFQ